MVDVIALDKIKVPSEFRAFFKNNHFQDEVLVNTGNNKTFVAGSKKIGECVLRAKWDSNRGYCVYASDSQDEYIGMPMVYQSSVIMAFFHFEYWLKKEIKMVGSQNSQKFGLSKLWEDIKDMDLAGRVKRRVAA